ncbi:MULTISPECIES: biotin/lipoyl-binding carrier protein [Bordetella]|uniref:Acetyl-CoA carboxylase biotin carboxyl carrier protein subunit n=3 Tax=Bordetella TaxID=517 RepID=A0ABX4FAT6_9BORD|nr:MULTISPECIES: biotin/lipoyl-binding carrier protein [Bordetella]SHR43675.1 Biotinylated protein TB7.3 homolog [Mycobacteroides abscessus subsp. abscessus]AOB26114.1 acetyl-CoA carboxylase biotin carboxyl carrier protein subunit [Bordetella bronchiseptica]ARP77601.1 acetyl-CoA carboxylase biotin carboxyl carrier protein subunit [Bordetella genomosp. 6]AZW21177.1 acetyl-CoA carboxylase biotin carboxyl carrier protein subunit [Bordetella bronchiseptica]AZW43400.1 acetyl-CoA carboxylase biotin 
MANVEVISEVSGSVWKVLVAAGDTVAEDQEIAILESMKMEIPVLAPCGGTIGDLRLEVGAPVSEGDVIAVISA